MVTYLRITPLLLLLVARQGFAQEESTLLIDNTQDIDNTHNSAINELKQISESLNDPEAPAKESTAQDSLEETGNTGPDPVPGDLSEPTILIDNTRDIDALGGNATDAVDTIGIDTPPQDIPTGLSEPTILIDSTQGIDLLDSETPGITDVETTDDVQLLLPEPTAEPNILIDKTQGIDKTLSPTIQKLKEVSETLKAKDKALPPEIPGVLPEEPVLVQPEKAAPDPTPATVSTPDKTAKPLLSLPRVIKKEEQKTLTSEHWTPNDRDLRILEIRVEQYKLEDVLQAYQYEDVVLLPLGTLSELLDLAITVEPGMAEGFIFKEAWTFMLDTERAEIIIQGVPDTYDRSLVHVLEDDIYVESNLLSEWMMMSFDIDLFSASIRIHSDEKLPFVKRLEREQRIAKSLARLNVKQPVYPKHHEAYQDWSIPFIDQTFKAGILKTETDTNLTYQSTTYATADLLEHEASLYAFINDQEGFDKLRFTMGRTDPESELLGPIKATHYEFGHVSEPRIDLVTISGAQEPGAAVNNYPVGRQTEYDRHRFRGDLLPGWEVELYHNNSLIGYQQEPVDGQYDFPDIPLLFGRNHFRLVFYGPQGQLREQSYNFELSQSLTKTGKHYYSASTSQDEVDGNRLTAQYDYGIQKNLSSSLAAASIPLQEGLERKQHTYVKAGLRGFWDAFFGTIDFIDDSAGGSAVDLGLQTRIDSTVIGFNNTSLSEFFSEEFKPSDIELSQRTSFRIDTAIPPSFMPRIPVSLQFQRDAFADGGELLLITNQLSTNVRGFAISNILRRQTSTGQDPLLNGTLQLSTRVDRVGVRGGASYELQPDSELTSLSVTVDPGQYMDYNLSFSLNHSLEQDVTDLSATANKLTGKYNLSFGARINTNSEISLDMGLSIGIGHEPRRDLWYTNARTIANQGSVSARVFIDADQDGIYGDNDEPLEDVGFRLNGGYNDERTEADGIAFLTGLPAHEPVNVVISPETLVDPLWTAALEGIQVTPRPGKAILLDFPVFVSGEVDGTVYLSRNGREFGVGNVTLELVDENNRVLNTTVTAYDGFYIMEKVPLGAYRIRVSPSQLEKLGLRPGTEPDVEISADKLFVNGIDFHLAPR